MQAAIVAHPPAKGLKLIDDQPVPQAGPGQVQVRMRAAALNRADLSVLAGHRHGAIGGPGTVIGMEWAGEVTALGEGVTGLAIGQRVMGTGAAAMAETVVAHAGRVSPLPSDAMDFATAATLPVALQTMHNALVTVGRLAAGERVLVMGASSGVGLMALQIARLRGASVVIGSSTDPERRAGLLRHGAHHAVDTRDANWPQQVLAMTDGQGVDLVIDQLSGDTANGSMAACALAARIVNVGRLAGMKAEFDFDLHALKRLEYLGVTFRTRTPAQVQDVVERMRADLWPAVQDGTLALPIAARFAFDQLPEAYALMADNRHFGKIVVDGP